MTASAIQPASESRWRQLLEALYPPQTAEATLRELQARVARHPVPASSSNTVSQRDALLIAYADHVQAPGEAPLQTLARFCAQRLSPRISGVHLLPFFPWTSDDGFSVKDYFAVAPEYGTWSDVAAFRPTFDLMFDAVFNHMSAQGDWFQRFLRDEPEFRDFFVTVAGQPDLSRVVRPRALPLLTEFATARGPEQVWTTFSADQVDVNVKNPRVLLALMEALLFYVRHGARFIRLDAIAYLWKEIGTTCIHLPQTHTVIQLMRAVLDQAAPEVQLITETNVPHVDNISYFGDGTNEAQLVYNFALPPLVLHALLRGDASHLSAWAGATRAPSQRTTFFNFLASHDGIGLNPARGILPPGEIDFLVERCQAHGGFINYKHNADGSKSPYEMNVVYFDALNDPGSVEPIDTQVDRFMVSQSIMLSLAGVPGIYLHSLLGSRNDREAALSTGINRRINRRKLLLQELETELNQAGSLRARVFERYARLLTARRASAAFHPHAGQQILPGAKEVFAVLRTPSEPSAWSLCLHHVTHSPITVRIQTADASDASVWTDLLTSSTVFTLTQGSVLIPLPAYGVVWLSGNGPLPVRLTIESGSR